MGLLEDVNASSVQSFGAAQGMAELLSSYGIEKVNSILPKLLKQLGNSNPLVRESFCQIFVYLPKALNEEFPQIMDQIIPPLLEALGDDSEPVRSVALRAIKIMIYMFHKSDYNTLLD